MAKDKDNLKKNKWYDLTIDYNGTNDPVKFYYIKNIDGIDYYVCEQSGKIISKNPLKDMTWKHEPNLHNGTGNIFDI